MHEPAVVRLFFLTLTLTTDNAACFPVALFQAAAGVRSAVNLRVKRVMEERGKGLPNVRVVEPATPITWGGESTQR